MLWSQKILQISWSHWVELLRLDDPWKRAFYENECLLGSWSVRQLQRQIGSLLYERTGLSKNKRAVVARARKQSAAAPATTRTSSAIPPSSNSPALPTAPATQLLTNGFHRSSFGR